MKPLFRSVSFWESALMTLPDTAFFDLLRSILGVIKTPYNKQKLIEELSRFIIRPEIQETIAAYIDDKDSRIIAAIALLAEPVPGELESFFSGEFSYAELQGLLLNLEERLIIYRFRDENVLRIALNPRLEAVLTPHAENTDILFSTEITGKKEPIESASLNDRTLAALFAFLLNNEFQIKEDSRAGKDLTFIFRKKAVEQGKALFPGLELDSIAGGIFTLGLITQKDGCIVPDETKVKAFKELPDQHRLEYLAAGIALFMFQGGTASNYHTQSLLKRTTQLIHSLSSTICEGKVVPESTLVKMMELFRRQEGTEVRIGWGFSGELPPAAIILKALVMAGLFTMVKVNETLCYCPADFNKTKKTAKTKALIAMDSSFSYVLYPEICFADAIDLAAFSTVEETGTTVRFLLTRDSVVQGFNRGLSADYLSQLLDRLSGNRLPEPLKWNLNDWETRWKEVSLNQGVVLSLGGDRDYLAQSGPLSGMIKQQLAPGVYLLSVDIDEAARALRSAGVDIVSQCRSMASSPLNYFPLPRTNIRNNTDEQESSDTATEEKPAHDTDAQTKAEQIKAEFKKVLYGMKFAKQEMEELESRIERRIIISETQLNDPSIRYEKLEARSMDYVGKTGIVRQAISTNSFLEISCLNGETVFGIPESLDKKGTDMVLSIKPRESKEAIKIPLGKISVVRRIKQSIFGN